MAEKKEKKKSRTVRIMAVRNNYRTGHTYYLVPLYRSSDRSYLTGLEEEFNGGISPSKRGMILKALDSSPSKLDELRVPIHHGIILKPETDNSDFGILSLAMLDPLIANSHKKVDVESHLFYISDVEKEAETDLSNERLVINAKAEVLKQGNIEKMIALALFLGGINIHGLSLNAIMANILKQCEVKPTSVIEFFENKHDVQVMIKELEYFKVIDLKSGVYYDGEMYIGALADAITFIANPANKDVVNSLGKRLIEAKTKT